jgi:21S rRNA (uridine2791-2'-O)-methyltransferase
MLQVAVERTRPHGLVIGIDLIPAQPPRGVNTIQGDFLSPAVQGLVKNFVFESHRRQRPTMAPPEEDAAAEGSDLERPSYIDMERHASQSAEAQSDAGSPLRYRVVDVRLAYGLPPFVY